MKELRFSSLRKFFVDVYQVSCQNALFTLRFYGRAQCYPVSTGLISRYINTRKMTARSFAALVALEPYQAICKWFKHFHFLMGQHFPSEMKESRLNNLSQSSMCLSKHTNWFHIPSKEGWKHILFKWLQVWHSGTQERILIPGHSWSSFFLSSSFLASFREIRQT